MDRSCWGNGFEVSLNVHGSPCSEAWSFEQQGVSRFRFESIVVSLAACWNRMLGKNSNPNNPLDFRRLDTA